MKKNVLFLLLIALASHLMAQGSNEGNPLGVDSTRVVKSQDIFLLLASGSEKEAMYAHQKVFKQKLGVYNVPDTAMIDEAASHMINESLVKGNQRMDLATGNFNFDQNEDLVAVWEGAGGEIEFYLPKFDSSANMWTDATQFTHPNAELPNYINGQDRGRISIKTADFDDDPLDELVLAWHDADGTIHLELYDTDWINKPVLLHEINNISLPLNPSEFADYSITTGDFDGDGKDELMMGVYHNSLKKSWVYYYDMEEGKLVPKHDISLRTSQENSVNNAIVLATGQFIDDSKEEVAYVVTDITSNNKQEVVAFVLEVDESSGEIRSLDNEKMGYSDSKTFRRLDVASGNLFGSERDEIIFSIGDWLRVYTVSDDQEIEYSYHIKALNDGQHDVRLSNNFLDAGDINQDGMDEIVMARSFYSGADQSIHIASYAARNDPDTIFRIGYEEHIALMNKPSAVVPHMQYAMALGNFDGQDFRIGKPVHYTRSGNVQPLVILNAPPVHFDVFDETIYDINNNYTGANFDFTSTYKKDNEESDELTTEVASDWQVTAGFYASGSISASVTGGASLGGVATATVGMSTNYETYCLGNYGQNFNKQEATKHSVQVSSTIEAADDDLIYATVTDYDVYEYPIYNGNSDTVNGTIVVAAPQKTEARWFPSKSWSASLFTPHHEVGNIMSYALYSDLEGHPDVDRPLKANLSEGFTVDANQSYDWSIKFEDFESTEDMENRIMGAEGKIQGAGFYFEANGTSSDMSTHTTSVSEGLEIKMHLGPGLNRSIGNTRYTVTPYSYWAKNGALVIDYMVAPELPSDQVSWWQEKYGDYPDPTMILPWRNDPEKGFRLADESERFKTSDISFDPPNPAPGDTAIITARIRNFALIPTPEPVTARFFEGDPDSGGELLTALDGSTSVQTDGIVESRKTKSVEFKWVVPSGYDAFTRIYVQLDPDDEIAEIHENNNKGWKTMGEKMGNPSTGIRDQEEVAKRTLLLQNYPNPFSDLTTIPYSMDRDQQVRIFITDLSGREIWASDEGFQLAGQHEIQFNGSQLSAGVYMIRLELGSNILMGKMIKEN
ncbi:MAG: T9SS type A sorting domain-containing protein [Bacteroides sp.]|nr:T9SS type A sorting domain-containing protein [Bacteroides sp.]